MEMRGKMVEADFEKDELTFKMAGHYEAAAGLYVILPVEEFARHYRRRDTAEEMMEMMRRDRSEVP